MQFVQKSLAAQNENLTGLPLIPRYIILHCCGYSQTKALNLLIHSKKNNGPGTSVHYFLPRSSKNSSAYEFFELVPPDQQAWHAGQSSWKDITSLNNCSLGIEFHQPNYAKALEGGELDWLYFEPYRDKVQLLAGIHLILDLMQKYQIPKENILGHSDIASWRVNEVTGMLMLGKTDPGATFPWEKFAEKGIGVWPSKKRFRLSPLDPTVKYCQTLLKEWGYTVPLTGKLDEKTKRVLRAFYWHYLPHMHARHNTGLINEEVIICLENLLDKKYEF